MRLGVQAMLNDFGFDLKPEILTNASAAKRIASRPDTRRRPRAFTDREAVAHRRDGTAVFIRVTVAKAAPLDGGVTT